MKLFTDNEFKYNIVIYNIFVGCKKCTGYRTLQLLSTTTASINKKQWLCLTLNKSMECEQVYNHISVCNTDFSVFTINAPIIQFVILQNKQNKKFRMAE